MRISDWSSDVCSSDLDALSQRTNFQCCTRSLGRRLVAPAVIGSDTNNDARFDDCTPFGRPDALPSKGAPVAMRIFADNISRRSEEHTSELQSLMRSSYADFCLKKKK